MYWKIPHKIKIYEALGILADGNRVEVVSENIIKVYSSSRNKFYNVYFDFESMKVYSNDNGSFYIGYWGYPIMIFLFLKGILRYDVKLANELKGIMWKDLNMKYNKAEAGKVPDYDFEGVIEEVNDGLSLECISYIEYVYERIQGIKIVKFDSLELEFLKEHKGLIINPPKAY